LRAETEVDRVVVDSLYDPLVHMLRNALDHGIETAEERLASNKQQDQPFH
jgi:two-component system chemotaxis sensor kinase CheA